MDPTPTEINGFNTLVDVMDWAGVVNVPATTADPAVPFRREFLKALGKPTLVREIALIPLATWNAAIKFKVDGDDLTPVQEGRVVSVRRICRLRCGMPADDPGATPSAASGPPPTAPPAGTACLSAVSIIKL